MHAHTHAYYVRTHYGNGGSSLFAVCKIDNRGKFTITEKLYRHAYLIDTYPERNAQIPSSVSAVDRLSLLIFARRETRTYLRTRTLNDDQRSTATLVRSQ